MFEKVKYQNILYFDRSKFTQQPTSDGRKWPKRLGIRWTIQYNRLIRMINPEATTGDEFNNRSVRANNKWRQVCTNMWMWTRYFITFSLFTYFHYTGTGSIQSSFMSWPIINCQEQSLTLYMPLWEISVFVEGSCGVRLGLATWMLFCVRSLLFIVTLSQIAYTVALTQSACAIGHSYQSLFRSPL